MTNLFINLYEDKNEARNNELLLCLQKNLENPLIDKIYIIGSVEFFEGENYEGGFYLKIRDNKKIQVIPARNYDDELEYRPTLRDFFHFACINSKEGDINIVSNTDIYFDETLKLVNNIGDNDCYALSRWELMSDSSLHQVQTHGDSQDCWIIKGKPKERTCSSKHEYHELTLGKYGIDNRLAYLLQEEGYNVTNPSLSIKAIHVHLTNVRNYEVERTLENTCQPPYLILPLTEIK